MPKKTTTINDELESSDAEMKSSSSESENMIPRSMLEELMANTRKVLSDNESLRKELEALKDGGVTQLPYAERVNVHYLSLLTFDGKYLVKMEKMKPSQFNLTWEEAGMQVRCTFLSNEKDSEGNYKEEVIETTQLFIQRTGLPINCQIIKREPKEEKLDLGIVEEAYRDADTGEVKKSGRMVKNILVQKIGEEFEVQLPDSRIIKVRENVVNIKGTDLKTSLNN